MAEDDMSDAADRTPKETPKRVLPPALQKNLWQPGQSGNPGGRPSLREHRVQARDIINRGAIERMAEIARLSDRDFNKDGSMKRLPAKADRGSIIAAIRWLDLVGYGPPHMFGPPEEGGGQFSGVFHPELLTEAQRQFVARALELIRQASVQPGVVEEVRKP